MKSKRYPNLHKYPNSPFWIFRKYSKEKRAEFVRSTREAKDEAKAYKKGLEAFNEWLGTFLPSGREVLIRDLGRAVLAGKKSKKRNTYATTENQILNHINPNFGHLRPSQVTPMTWDRYDELERRKGKRTKTGPTRRVLKEILLRAQEEGLIRSIPKFRNHDGPAAAPVYLDRQQVRAIWHAAGPATKLWVYVMWKQGPRPGELMQYEKDMIRWGAGGLEGKPGKKLKRQVDLIDIPGSITKTGRARTIPLNSRVSRVLRWILRWATEWQLEVDYKGPRSVARHFLTTRSGRTQITRQQARRVAYIIQLASSPFFFPSATHADRPMKEYKTGWENAIRKAQVDADPYNLRDTAITNMLMLSSSDFVAKYVDNSPAVISQKYVVPEAGAMRRVAG
jgi:integrase